MMNTSTCCQIFKLAESEATTISLLRLQEGLYKFSESPWSIVFTQDNVLIHG